MPKQQSKSTKAKKIDYLQDTLDEVNERVSELEELKATVANVSRRLNFMEQLAVPPTLEVVIGECDNLQEGVSSLDSIYARQLIEAVVESVLIGHNRMEEDTPYVYSEFCDYMRKNPVSRKSLVKLLKDLK